MAGENLARIVRSRAVSLARRYATERDRCGDAQGADAIRDLIGEIQNIEIPGENNG